MVKFKQWQSLGLIINRLESVKLVGHTNKTLRIHFKQISKSDAIVHATLIIIM